MSNKDTPSYRLDYFAAHILPWVVLILTLVLISIVYYHYKRKTCFFEKEEKTKDEISNNIPYINI